MNDELNTKEYLKSMEQIKLSDSSRERVKNDLLAHVRFHAVIEETGSVTPQRSPFMRWLSSPVPAAFALVFLVGTTSLLAKEAAPGDFLYAVRTGVNENVRAVFARVTSDTKQPDVPSKVELANATTPENETVDSSSDKDRKNQKDTKPDKTLAITARTNTLPENGDAALAAEVSSDLSTTLSKGAISVEAYTSDVKLRDKTLRDLIKKYDPKLEVDVKNEFKTKLDQAAALTAKTEGTSEEDARANLDKASVLIGEVEATLSTFGQVEIKNGVIVDIDFTVDPLAQ